MDGADQSARRHKEPPPGYTTEEKIREFGIYQGRRDKFYYEPGTRKQFRSLKSAWEHYNLKQKNEEHVIRSDPITPIQWHPPIHGIYKANFDGVVFDEDHTVGLGVVIRNEIGEFMAGFSKKITCFADAEYAAIRAALEATKFALDIGFCDVVFEGDAVDVIKAISEVDDNFSGNENLFEEVKHNLKKFGTWEVSVIHQIRNQVAHELARNARFISDMIVWMEDAPDFVVPYILADQEDRTEAEVIA